MWSLRGTSSKRLGEPVDSEDQFEVSFVWKQTKNLLSDRFLLEKDKRMKYKTKLGGEFSPSNFLSIVVNKIFTTFDEDEKREQEV